MSYTVVVTKVDPQLKNQAQAVAKSLGLSLSAVIKRLLREFIHSKSITFSREDEIPNVRTRRILKKAEENYQKGNTSPVFHTARDAIKYLEEQGI